MTTSRVLAFKSNHLGVDANLLLSIGSPSQDGQSPIVWKVVKLAAEGPSKAVITYQINFAFCVPDVKNIDVGNYMPILPGQSTELSTEPGTNPPVYRFSSPKTIGGIMFTATNSVGQEIDLGFGIINDFGTEKEEMNTISVFHSVAPSTSVEAEFAPILSAYIAFDYTEKAILKGRLETTDPIWSQNLLNLEHNTSWIVGRTATGKFEVEPGN